MWAYLEGSTRLLPQEDGDDANPGACQLHPICFSTPGPGYTSELHLTCVLRPICSMGAAHRVHTWMPTSWHSTQHPPNNA